MKKFLVALFLVVITCITLWGFIQTPDLPDVHDPTIAFRVSTFIETLKTGQFPAAWHNTLNYGYGYPLNLYYAPLFNYLALVPSIITNNVVLGIKLTLIGVTLFGLIGIYLLMRSYGRIAALTAVLAYAMLPYHALLLYVRGAYAEFLTVSLFPWLIYVWTRPRFATKRHLSLVSVITALFLLSHNTTPFLALVTVIPALILTFQRQNLRQSFFALLLSFSLTLVFLTPVFFERNLIQVDTLASTTQFREHFVDFAQLWYSPWGYGGSAAGTSHDNMSFMLGKAQLILGLVGVVIALYHRFAKILLISLPLLLLTLLAVSISQPLWELFHYAAFIQFPWRVLGFATLGLAILSGFVFTHIPGYFKHIGFILISYLLISSNITYFRAWNYHQFNNDILTSTSNLYPLAKHKIPEYLPAWMPDFPLAAFSDGLTRTPTRVSGQLSLDESRPLVIQTAYMPHWNLQINGVTQVIVPTKDGLIMTKHAYGPGTYDLDLTWQQTKIERYSTLLSLAALMLVIGLAL